MTTKGKITTQITIPDLDQIVLNGLSFLSKNGLNKITAIKKLSWPLVVGSGNAFHAGRILFKNQATIFADESNFRQQLKAVRPLIKKGLIKEAVIISASGEKDAVWEVKAAKQAGLSTHLLTCQANSTAARLADTHQVFPKAPEPYSYNFSTYLSMILSVSKESPIAIKNYLLRLKRPKEFLSYKYFSFILPDEFRVIADMLTVKDDELFGPYSSLRAYSKGQARHAKFICQSKQELVISFGPNKFFGPAKQRWSIKLPKDAQDGLALSLAYYLVGLIQASRTPHFKRGLPEYCLTTGPRPYGRKNPFPIIVN